MRVFHNMMEVLPDKPVDALFGVDLWFTNDSGCSRRPLTTTFIPIAGYRPNADSV